MTELAETITMSVGDLAHQLGEDPGLVNFIRQHLNYPSVKVNRLASGSLSYGITTRALLEGARVVMLSWEQELAPLTKDEVRKRLPDLERKLVDTWRWTFGTNPVRAVELIPYAGDLVNELASDRGKANAMGQRLSRMCGRQYGAYTVAEVGRKKNTAIYQLQRIAPQAGGSE